MGDAGNSEKHADESDGNKSDDDSDDDTPVTARALKKLLRELFEKKAKRGRKERRRSRAKPVNEVDLEKEQDEKWQRSNFCVCVPLDYHPN
jgi:hypothetical protein